MERRKIHGKKLAQKYITKEEEKEARAEEKRKARALNKNKKSPKLVIKHRVAVIHELKLLGYGPTEILELINHGGVSGNDDSMRWGITYGTMMYYGRKAIELSEEIIKEDVKGHYEAAIRRWSLLIRKFHKEGDNTNLLKATKELDELLNLRKTNINISGLLNVNEVTGLSNEDLDAAIAEAERAITGK